MKTKMKGITVQQLGTIAVFFVIAAITISIGAQILEDLKADQNSSGAAYNITGKAITGVATLGDWLPLIALVIAAAVVIGILIRYLGGVVAGGA